MLGYLVDRIMGRGTKFKDEIGLEADNKIVRFPFSEKNIEKLVYADRSREGVKIMVYLAKNGGYVRYGVLSGKRNSSVFGLSGRTFRKLRRHFIYFDVVE